MRFSDRSRPLDWEIAALADRQHGIVSYVQLLALGLHRRAIQYRIECGRLHAVHQGVYSVGHRLLTDEGRWMAAVLASGEGAVLSHRSAAALWGVWQARDVPETTTAAHSRETRRGLRIHHSLLPYDEVTERSGIPVTAPARTLLDVAAVSDRQQLRKTWRETEFLRLVTVDEIARLLRRHPGRRGVARLRAVISVSRPGERLRSELEARFRRLVDRYGIPRPRFNERVEIRGREREWDAVWHDARVLVELDGRGAHEIASAFEDDRQRDREAALDGWVVIRVAWRQIRPQLATDLIELIAGRRSRSA